MTPLDWERLQPGDALPAVTLPPVSRATLALFAGASGDHNPVHIDIDFARAAGLPDVFAHGMLGLAWLGRLLTNWAPQDRLHKLEVRFLGITQLGEVVTCSGTVVEKCEVAGRPGARLQVQATNQQGEVRIAGEAWVQAPAP
ncbi:MAG: MaoC/PaaZ C-terminal domain-containing protein [Burkholderiales bacterium]